MELRGLGMSLRLLLLLALFWPQMLPGEWKSGPLQEQGWSFNAEPTKSREGLGQITFTQLSHKHFRGFRRSLTP